MGKSKRERNKHLSAVEGPSLLENRIILSILAAIAFLTTFIYFPTMTTDDSDIWFHLKYGEYFVNNHTWHIDHSIFSWTHSDPDWKYVSWVGDIFFYYLYGNSNIIGFYVLQWAIFIGILAGFFFYLKQKGLVFDINVLAGIVLVFASLNPTAIYIKPEMITLLFFAITVFIYVYSKSVSKNYFFLYPLIFLIWVNIHGGFLLGLSFISLLLAGEFMNYRFRKEASLSARKLKSFLISVALSYAAVQINPYGVSYLPGLLKIFFSQDYARDINVTTAYFSLWKFLFTKKGLFRLVINSWSMIIMFISFILMSIQVYGKEKYFDAALTAVNILFFFIGMSMARASFFFPLIWMFTMVFLVGIGDFNRLRRRVAPVSLVFFLIVAGYFGYFSSFYTDQRTWFGKDFTEIYPVKEVQFIRESNLPGPIFCDYDNGSYLLWALYPDHKVFIDSRYGPYVKDVWPDYIDLMKNLNPQEFGKFISKYPFQLAVTAKPGLITLLMSSGQWRLLYFDRSAAVIGHKSLVDSGNLKLPSVDMGTERFRNIRTPSRLLWAFWIYFNSGAIRQAEEIIDIYRNNVSDFYRLKNEHIRRMESIVRSKK